MAIDKAVDSAVLDSTLTAIADAIREKGGTTDPIAFDAMAAAVAAIEAGGGLKMETGTVTFAEDTTNVYMPPYEALTMHGMTAPIFVAVYPTEQYYHSVSKGKYCPVFLASIEPGQTLVSSGYVPLKGEVCVFYQSTTLQLAFPYSQDTVNQNANGLVIDVNGSGFTYPAGLKYKWVCLWE